MNTPPKRRSIEIESIFDIPSYDIYKSLYYIASKISH